MQRSRSSFQGAVIVIKNLCAFLSYCFNISRLPVRHCTLLTKQKNLFSFIFSLIYFPFAIFVTIERDTFFLEMNGQHPKQE